MDLNVTAQAASELTADAIVIGVASEGPQSAAAESVNRATAQSIRRVRESGEFGAKVAEVIALYGLQGVAAPVVVLVGLGKPREITTAIGFKAAGAAAKWLAGKPRKNVGFYLADGLPNDVGEAMVAGAIIGATGQDRYRTQRNRHPISVQQWSHLSPDLLAQGRLIGESCNLTRQLVNEPPNLLYPETFAQEAERISKGCGIECEIWDENRLNHERCGSLLAVAKGSTNPPRLVILRYLGAGKNKPIFGFVGKGVTFDSGGLSLKPTDGMTTMKCDMAGAATVLGAMQAIAQLKLPINVTGFLGLVENMPSGGCLKLGDILTARSGKTIEVLNTDAEGRLVLADVLDVAIEQGASKLIDLATLTGACVVALGTDVAGVMSNNESWGSEVLLAAKSAGELAWPLPMFREFDEQIQSEVADIKNVGNGRWGGAITAAKFLEAFVGEVPWVHVDIAGPAFAEKPKAWIDGGGSGYFVRTLVQLCRNLSS